MKYSEVLRAYKPVETGDFMYRYSVNNRDYVIYSPEEGTTSCVELYEFIDLTPQELSFFIPKKDRVGEMGEIEEFRFNCTCSKEKLIAYLFDVVADQKEGQKVKCRNENDGYLLYALKANKVRNLFQFNPLNKKYRLIFKNKICYTSIDEDLEATGINVCWNPIVFNSLERAEIAEKKPSFLLASAHPLLSTYIIGLAGNRQISLWENKLDTLLFFSLYTHLKGLEKSISVFSESNPGERITVSMKNWHPVTLVKFISKLQKAYIEQYEYIYNEVFLKDIIVYKLESIAGNSFITFPNKRLVIGVFLENILLELKINDISIRE